MISLDGNPAYSVMRFWPLSFWSYTTNSRTFKYSLISCEINVLKVISRSFTTIKVKTLISLTWNESTFVTILKLLMNQPIGKPNTGHVSKQQNLTLLPPEPNPKCINGHWWTFDSQFLGMTRKCIYVFCPLRWAVLF